MLIMITSFMLPGCSADSVNRAGSAKDTELYVSAAASLAESLRSIGSEFENEHRSIRIIYNFAGSGTLKQQIQHGAPTDLFISAEMREMRQLVESGLIAEDDWLPLFSNRLIAVAGNHSAAKVNSVHDLTDKIVKKIAVGHPDSVPVGAYTKELLVQTGLWDKLADKIIYAKDARQVLHYVETGNADVGFVYATDAMVSRRVTKIFTPSSAQYSEIVYQAGMIKLSEHRKEVKLFYNYLRGQTAKQIFAQYGFVPLEP
jgi:molybdate transport system substrate-binding protein